MARRFGDFCYLIGLLIAVPAGCVSIYGWFDDWFYGSNIETAAIALYMFAWFGGIPLVIGWFIRYIIIGRVDFSPAPTPTE